MLNLQGLFAAVDSLSTEPGWTAGGTIVAALTLAATLWLYRRTRSVKSISYRVSATPVEAQAGFELSRHGQPVPNGSVVRWTLKNEGTLAIKKADFERPIALILGAGSQPLEPIKVERQNPRGLQPRVVAGRNRLIFLPQLLNAGDSFTVSAIVAGYIGPEHLDGRVADVHEFIDAEEASRRQATLLRRTTGLCATAAVIALVALVSASSQPRSAAAPGELGLAVRSWSIVAASFRGQYQFVLGVNAYANSPKQVDIRLERFRLLVTTLDLERWRPPGGRPPRGPRLVDVHGKRVWAVPATANGTSVVNPTTGIRTLPSLWSARMLERGQSYPARQPDGVMTFYLPRRDIINTGTLSHVLGLAYVSAAGKVVLIDEPHAWGPRRAAAEV